MNVLGDVCENLDSKRVPITKNKRSSGPYPYYGASGVVDHVGDYLFDEDLLLVSEDGANLLARTYPIAFSVSGKVWVNNHAHVLKFADMESQRFIEFYINSIPLDSFVSGMAQPKLNQRSLNSIPVPAPPLPQQRRIIGILDEAFDGIAAANANAERNLENARDLFESHLDAVFRKRDEEWEERGLDQLATFRNGINFTKSSRGDSVRIMGVKDFQTNYWVPLDDLDTVTINGTLRDSDTVRENDLLFVRANGNVELIGRSLLVGAGADRITHSGFTIRGVKPILS